jgi:predicted P-loop ATPase/GTPase
MPAEPSPSTPDSGEYLDWMCISLRRLSDDDRGCVYQFSSNLYRAVGPNRNEQAEAVSGRLKLVKKTGKFELLEPMPGDSQRRVADRAAQKVFAHWKAGELPETTVYVAG